MIQELCILHQAKPNLLEVESVPTWSTCLRTLAFVPRDYPTLPADRYLGHEAYRFLLEIVCGLHSPIVGETEVLGQFKEFAKQWESLEPARATLIQQLLADAKAIRSRYLSGIGQQSYGSWVRKNLNDSRVHILGAGHLTSEILPYLLKTHHEVVVHVRDPQKFKRDDVEVVALAEKRFDKGAVIVAAPMTAAEIGAWMNEQQASQIFDLRDTSESDALAAKSAQNIFKLNNVFAEIESTRARLKPVLQEVAREIEERVQKITERSLLRPMGWDDLCN